MPKIMHIGDVHLDAPFSLLDVQKAAARRNELRGTFSSAVMYAKSEQFDIVLIAGDLFDGGFVTRETMQFLCRQFASAPTCRFIIAPGNHDYYSSSSPYAKTVFPENVWVFESEKLSVLHFDDLGVDVYGYAFEGETMKQSPLAVAPGLDPAKFNLLVGHADLDAGVYCPLSREEIAESGFDYCALGHIHLGGDVGLAGNTYFAYSGCLEGRSFDECGIKGAILCIAEREGNKKQIRFKARRFCTRHYEKIELDVSRTRNAREAMALLRSAVTEKGFGTDTLLRVTLKGKVPADADLRADRWSAEDIGVFYLEMRDETAAFAGYEALKGDLTIKGAFYRELLPLLESEDEETRHRASLALQYGMAALSGEEVVDY